MAVHPKPKRLSIVIAVIIAAGAGAVLVFPGVIDRLMPKTDARPDHAVRSTCVAFFASTRRFIAACASREPSCQVPIHRSMGVMLSP